MVTGQIAGGGVSERRRRGELPYDSSSVSRASTTMPTILLVVALVFLLIYLIRNATAMPENFPPGKPTSFHFIWASNVQNNYNFPSTVSVNVVNSPNFHVGPVLSEKKIVLETF